ncbi:sodium:solute symporter family protein [Verrucomicrobiaceae bacterium N1E253]|uniref:Sodium:solute symporter family protein n=1 Tax=Oceaniferula marina TaxID=2748318 RepID=A0A851GL48_9BACT|nr:sodium:solute symporter family protein [Oceaniferula marina]NWK56561.1 sodium:solute symporter family protein [Oceaniferula marina]
MFGLGIVDLVVIAVYFLAMVGIGFWAMSRIKNQEDFFLGGRRMGKIIQIFANFGQATSSDTGPSVATTTYHNGAAGIWSALMMVFATPFFWFTSVWYRRMRVMTLGDFFTKRYHSKGIGGAYSALMAVGLCVLLSLGFISMLKTVQALTPKAESELTVNEKAEYARALELKSLESMDASSLSVAESTRLENLRQEAPRQVFSHMNKHILVWSIVIIVCLYSIAGGLEAALISDLIQGVFILLLSVMLIPFAADQINAIYGGTGLMGAFEALHEQKSMSFFQILGSPKAMDFTWYYIAAIGFMGLITATAQANTFVTPSSSKDEYSARFGMTFGIYLKRLVTVLWGVTAMFAVLLFADKMTDPDLLWGYASRELLGPLNMGLIGLMIAALMAALMSTADMMMITASGLITHNLYRPLFPNKSEKHYVAFGRCVGGLVVLGAAVLTLASDSVLGLLKLWWEFGTVFAASLWMGILWKKTTSKAVWAQMTLSTIFFFTLPLLSPLVPGLKTNAYLLKQTESRSIEQVYPRATQEDVDRQSAAIAAYEKLAPEDRSSAPPDVIKLNEPWSKSYLMPRKSVFWTDGIEVETLDEGTEVAQGKGRLNVLLVVIDKMGFDLSANPYALNETIRVLLRTFLPFVLLIIVSLMTRRSKEEEEAADQTAARILTPVLADGDEDAQLVAQHESDPSLVDDHKLFGPNSHWTFSKWNKVDAIGFGINVLALLAIIGFLYFVVGLGG